MSWITDVVVHLDLYGQGDVVAKFCDHAAKFEWSGRNGGLRLLSATEAGGSKVFCSHVVAGSFNHLPQDDYIAHLRTFDWGNIDAAAITLLPEEGPMVVEILYQCPAPVY